MNVLSLFSGIAGLDIGIKIAAPEAKVVCHVEFDAYCRRVLLARMSDGSLDPCPIWGDVRTFDGRPWRGVVDCIAGGFPCQDISNAGKRAGIGGERSRLWSEFARLVGEVRPRYVFVENVGALLVRGMDVVLGDLSDLGYDAEWLSLSAAAVGAPHLRKRIFILAHADAGRQPKLQGSQPDQRRRVGNDSTALADTEGVRGFLARPRDGRQVTDDGEHAVADAEGVDGERTISSGAVMEDPDEQRPSPHGARRADVRTGADVPACPSGDGVLPIFPPGPADRDGWRAYLEAFPNAEPSVCRTAARLPHRVDRLKALGNSVVPLQAAAAFTILLERIKEQS